MTFLLNNPATTFIAYNGVTFPPHSRVRAVAYPVYSEDGRTLKYRKYTINIESIWTADALASNADPGGPLNPGDPLDSSMEIIRQLLTEPQGHLQLTDQGFGDLDITGADDQDFGPKPQQMTWEPVGSRRAVRTVWSFDVVLACEEHGDIATSGVRFHQFCYSIDYSIGENGLTTRTVSGVAECPSHVVNGLIDTSADSLRVLISIPKVAACQRRQTYRLSTNKKLLYFTVMDTQIASDNSFYPGIISMSMKQKVALPIINPHSGLRLTTVTFTAAIKVKPGVDKTIALAAFLYALSVRMQVANGTSTADRLTVMITDYNVEEEIFGYDVGFGVTYLVKIPDLHDLYQITQLFRPLSPDPTTDWAAWQDALSVTQGPRGSGQMQHLASDDRVLNPCSIDQPASINNQVVLTIPQFTSTLLQTLCPAAEHSWWTYKNLVTYTKITSAVIHTPLGTPDHQTQTKVTSIVSTDGTLYQTQPQTNPAPSTVKEHTVQGRAASQYTIILSGWAVRMGHKIEPPYVEAIGGVVPNLIKEVLTPSTPMNANTGCTLYRAAWYREYAVTSPNPQQFPVRTPGYTGLLG